MNIITRICASLEARLSQPWLNPLRTVYFCFRTMPFRTALKLPVFIYGRHRLFGLNGKVEFTGTPVTTGMVKIGINRDSFTLFDHSGFIQLGSASAKIIFEGPAVISVNAKIRVVSGTLTMGKYSRIQASSKIVCNGSYIKIGNYSGITHECVVMNSGFHHIYNVNTRSLKRATRPIVIGDYCWIGNRSSVTAGAVLKDHTIVCSNSLVNRDYSKAEGDFPLLGGAPAKVIGCGYKRIFSPQKEMQVIRWFREHPGEDTLRVEDFEDDYSQLNSEFTDRIWT